MVATMAVLVHEFKKKLYGSFGSQVVRSFPIGGP